MVFVVERRTTKYLPTKNTACARPKYEANRATTKFFPRNNQNYDFHENIPLEKYPLYGILLWLANSYKCIIGLSMTVMSISLFMMHHRLHSSKVVLRSAEGSKGHERMPHGTSSDM